MTGARTPLQRFVAPARSRPALWRLVLGLALLTVLYAIGAALVLIGGWVVWGQGQDPLDFVANVAAASDPLSVALLLASFLPMALATMVTVRLVHRRSAGSLFGNGPRVLRDFATAAIVVGALYASMLAIWALTTGEAVPGLEFRDWVMWLPILLVGLIIQTGAEEMVFRGYIQQQLAARFSSPAVWLIVPAVLFGAVHYDPVKAGDNIWFVLAGVTLFGLIAGDLTAKTGSLGAAWGFHFANNAFAILIVGTSGMIDGAALYRTPYALSETDLYGAVILMDLSVMALAWFLVRRAVSR